MSKLETRLSLDNSGFLAKMVESGAVTEREGQRMQRALKYVSDQMKVMERATAAANDTTVGLKSVSHEMEQVGFHTAAAKRELLVLGHELASGNYKRFGASLLVLGERTGAASLLFSGMGLAAIGAAGAVGLLAYEIVKGAKESNAFSEAIQMTGNYAGVTAGKFDDMAASIAQSTNSTIGKSRDALQAVIATGAFGPKLLQQATEATERYASISGETAEKVAQDFAKMSEGVAKSRRRASKANAPFDSRPVRTD